MSGIWAMASGVLARDPERRHGANGDFAIATVRVGAGDNVQWISAIAFGDAATRLLSLRAGDGVSVAGRGEVKTWQGRDGEARSGLSVVANEIAAARPRPRPRETAPRQAPGGLYQAPTRSRPSGTGPALDDRLDDLWPGAS